METSTSQMILAGLIAVAFITGAFTVLSSFVPSNDNNFAQYNQTYSKFNEMNQNSQAMTNNVKTATPNAGLLGMLDALIKVTYGSLAQVWNTMSTIITILDDLSTSIFGLPFWFTGLLSTSILVILAFALVAIYFHWRA